MTGTTEIQSVEPFDRDAIMTVAGLALTFGGLRVLDDVGFTFRRGEIVGLIGPNGAGKTALLNCLTGFYEPQHGSMVFDGHELAGERTGRIAGLGIARTFQQAASMGLVGARDLMLMGRECFMPKGVLRYATPWARRYEQEAVERVRQVAFELGILEHVDDNTMLDELPYGVRKLADLGRALVGTPSLLLMDEPLAGLHRAEKDVMATFIRRTKQRGEITQVLVDHDLEFVSEICDRLIVLNAGVKLAEGAVGRVLAMEEVIQSYVGISAKEFAGESNDQSGDAR